MLNEAIKARLGADPAIKAIVQDRITPMITPEFGDYPAISYFHVDEPHEYELAAGPAGLASPRIQIDCWSNGADQAWELSELVKNSLSGFRGTIGDVTITSSTCKERRDIYEPGVRGFRVICEFTISHHE